MTARRQTARSQTAPEFFSKHVSKARRFYLDLSPSKRAALSVVCGGVESCTPDYVIQRPTFPFYSIEYVAQGEGTLVLGGNPFALHAGRLFSYGPGIAQHITGNADAPLVKYFVDFAGTRAAELLRSCGLKPGTVSEVFPPPTLQAIFDEIIQAGLQVRPGSAELCSKLLECLALRIAGARAPISGAESLAFTTYQQCRQHIETHCLRLRTLEQIAAECHVNDAYLCRLFRRYDNQSPYQYLLRLKMNFAAEQLQRPDALIKQIAEETGFADPFHFSRVFRSIFGISPNKFRQLR